MIRAVLVMSFILLFGAVPDGFAEQWWANEKGGLVPLSHLSDQQMIYYVGMIGAENLAKYTEFFAELKRRNLVSA